MKLCSWLVKGVGGIALAAAGCSPVILVSPYDEVTETNLGAFKETLNVFFKGAVIHAGTPEGTFEACQDQYTQLEVKIDNLIDRAKLQPQGIGCKIDDNTWTRIKSEFARAAGLPSTNGIEGEPAGCVVLMLNNVKLNLADAKGIHQDAKHCGLPLKQPAPQGELTTSAAPAMPSPQPATCLREAASKDILAISNQTIDAVLLVEQTMKTVQEEKK